MAKTRIKTFRRNSRRKRNTRRKIRGGGPTLDMRPLLKEYLMNENNLLKDKVIMLQKFIGSLTKEAGIKLVGLLIESRYIIQRKKIKQLKCVKEGLLQSIRKTETQSKECKDAFTEIEKLKKENNKILTRSERFKLRHKTLGGLNSKMLSTILFDSIRKWKLADEIDKNIHKRFLQQYFSSKSIELPELTKEDIELLSTQRTNVAADFSEFEQKGNDGIELLKNKLENTNTNQQPQSIDQSQAGDYDNFLEIIGLDASDTISEVEFNILAGIYTESSGVEYKGGDPDGFSLLLGSIIISPFIIAAGGVALGFLAVAFCLACVGYILKLIIIGSDN